MTSPPLLEVRGLVTEFRTETGTVRAVKGVDLVVGAGETVALVGESGSGKSVTSLSIMRLIPSRSGGIAAGEVLFRGRNGVVRDLVHEDEAGMRRIRGNEISMVFQEPMTCLNPTLTVGRQIAETVELHQGLTARQSWARALEMLTLVEIRSPPAGPKSTRTRCREGCARCDDCDGAGLPSSLASSPTSLSATLDVASNRRSWT